MGGLEESGGFEWVGGGVSRDSIFCTDPADYKGQGDGAASRVCGPFFIRSLVDTVPKAPLDVKVGNYTEAE